MKNPFRLNKTSRLIEVPWTIALCGKVLPVSIIMAGLFLPAHSFAGKRYSTNNGAWNATYTWSATNNGSGGASVPTATDTVYINDGSTVTIPNAYAAVCSQLVFGGANPFSPVLSFYSSTSTLTVTNNFITIGATGISQREVDVNSGVLTVGGYMSLNESCANISYRWATRFVITSGTVTVSGNLIINMMAGCDPHQCEIYMSGGAGTFNLGGTFTLSNGIGTLYPGFFSTFNYNGTAAQTVLLTSYITYANLTINNTNAAVLGAAITPLNVAGNLRVQSGTLQNGGYDITGYFLTTLQVDDGATLMLGGTTGFPTGYGAVTLGTRSTIDYSGSNQVVSLKSYGNLKLSSSGGAAVVKTMPSAAMSLAGDFITAATNTGTTVSATALAALTVAGNVQIGASTTFTAGSFTHSIAGTWTNNGTFDPGTSTCNLNGSSSQSLGGTAGTTFNNLVLANTAGVSLSSAVKITNFLSFGSVNNSVLTTNGLLTLGSAASGTASLKDITNAGLNSGNSINGSVTIERYVQAKRAYRFLSAPVNSTTSIRANWMENTNNPSTAVNNNPVLNYGTHITGPGGNTNGFDVTGTNNSSMFSFNASTQSWVAVPNTSGWFMAGTGYRIMVRGNRSVDLNDNNAAASVTTLRAKGTLVTGTVTMAASGGGGTAGMPQLSAVTGAYNFIANPYASAVNWLSLAKNDMSTTIYIYDPTVAGSNGRGGYVAYNGTLNINNTLNSVVDNNIQGGQAFFVQTTGPNPSITFKETDKSLNYRQVFRTAANELTNFSVQLLLPSQVNTAASADGTKVYFSDDFNTAIGDEDSYKLTNMDENIAVLRNSTTLSIEGRKPVYGADTVQLKIWQLSQTSYSLKVAFDKFPDNVEAYLQDSYLHVTKPLDTYGENLIPFSITSDAASKDPNRFRVVFESLATLPVRLTGIKAYAKNKGVQVDWVAESESSMDLYEVERSSDAHNFKTIGSSKAKNNPGIASAYTFFDVSPAAGDNYYRIKSIEKSGDVKLSEIMKVQVSNEKNTVSVINNPVQGSLVKLLFDNVPKGTYVTSLINAAGEKIYSGKISYTGGTTFIQIDLNAHPPAGVYQLQLNNSSLSKTIPVLIQ